MVLVDLTDKVFGSLPWNNGTLSKGNARLADDDLPPSLEKISKPKHTRLKFDLKKLKDPNVLETFQAMIQGCRFNFLLHRPAGPAQFTELQA